MECAIEAHAYNQFYIYIVLIKLNVCLNNILNIVSAMFNMQWLLGKFKLVTRKFIYLSIYLSKKRF